MVELSDEVDQVRLSSFLGEDFYDLLSNKLDLLVLSVAGLSSLGGLSAGESSDENSQDITILGLDFAVSVNEGLPLSDVLAELISGHVETVEVGQAVSSFDVFDAELDLSPKRINRI